MEPGPRNGKTGAHLLKHAVTPEIAAAAAAAFGPDQVEAGRAILDLKQPRLRQMFQEVFLVTTGSGNNAWMKSKLLQAVGLGPHWRPPKDGPPDEEPAEGTPRTGRRQRRPPVALQHAQLDSQGSGSSEQAARSRQGPDGRSQGSGGDGRAKRARWQGATSAPPPPAPAPPMVVLVVADPQGRVPAWPGIMQLPASLAAGRLPFVQAANGGWQLPAGDMLLQQVQEAQQQAAQQAWKQQQAQQVWQQAQQAQQAPQQGPPPALLSIEDVLLPQVTGAEDAAQQAAWEALRGVGFVPSPAGGPAAAPMPAHVSRTVTTGAALPGHQQQQAFTQAVGRQLAVQQPAAQRSVSLSLSRSAGASPGRPGKPAPSPFAAEAARPVLVEEQCGPQCAPLPASQPGQPLQGGGDADEAGPLPSLQPGDFSLLGLSTMGLSGLCGASLASVPTPSSDLHRLFSAWEQGLVSLSLSRRELQSL